MPTELIEEALANFGSWPAQVTALQVKTYGNCCWLVEPSRGEAFVLRRYHDEASEEDLAYEHSVLRFLSARGWVVPEPVGDLIRLDRWWWVPTRLIPGDTVQPETVDQRARRGRDLARLHHSLRELDLGQRPGWRSQHTALTVHTDIDWESSLATFTRSNPELAEWAAKAADAARVELRSLGAEDLPTLVIHGDFHELNVHYGPDGLSGVLDFGLSHLDSRPQELAIARTHRSPEVIDAFREESERLGWPLSDLEEACIVPIRSAFRIDMVAWQLHHGERVGSYDTRWIESQLSKTSTPRP